MQVLGRGFQINVSEQNLNGAQIGARLQQVSRPTVAQGVWGDAFADASALRGLATCNPDGLVGNRLIERPATSACGEHVELRLPPAPILSQRLQQSRTQGQVTIFAALAL